MDVQTRRCIFQSPFPKIFKGMVFQNWIDRKWNFNNLNKTMSIVLIVGSSCEHFFLSKAFVFKSWIFLSSKLDCSNMLFPIRLRANEFSNQTVNIIFWSRFFYIAFSFVQNSLGPKWNFQNSITPASIRLLAIKLWTWFCFSSRFFTLHFPLFKIRWVQHGIVQNSMTTVSIRFLGSNCEHYFVQAFFFQIGMFLFPFFFAFVFF